MRRTAIGFDTFDLLLDLVISPDLSQWTWKDEDEYTHGRRLRVVSESDHLGSAPDQSAPELPADALSVVPAPRRARS